MSRNPGMHRRPARWVRAELPPLRERIRAAWAAVADWLRLVWANLAAGDGKPARRGYGYASEAEIGEMRWPSLPDGPGPGSAADA
jgi:hypothetical protein